MPVFLSKVQVAADVGAGREWPRVSVVILAHNRQDKVRVTLERTLSDLDYPEHLLQVIVVDNASSDNTVDVIREDFPGVEVIASDDNLGVAGWNLGFERASGDYMLVLDDDCYLQGSSLKRAVASAMHYEASLVSFTIRSTYEEKTFNERFKTGLLSFWGCAALISRQAVTRLKGYDPHIFLWGNELDFTMRLLDAGMRHLFLPEVEAYHMKRVSRDYPYEARRLNTRHHAYIAAKLLHPYHALCICFRLLRRLVLASLKQVQVVGILPDLLWGIRTGLRNRQPVRREVSACYMKHFAYFRSQLPLHLHMRTWDAFFKKRPHLYPETATILEL